MPPGGTTTWTWSSAKLEVSAQRLFALNGFEEGLEIALAERRRAVALDHLEEDGRPVLRRLGEDLQQVAVLVAVRQDLQALQVGVVLRDLADPPFDLLVVSVGSVEEEDAALLQLRNRADDVLALHRDVLDAGRVVELEVLLDLALALPLGRLVDRELDLAAPVRHHLRHQRRVFRLNLIVAEVDDVGHTEDTLVKLHPGVHASELDVADHVVELLQADPGIRMPVLERRAIAGQIRAGVVLAIDEGVDDVAVGRDRGKLDAAELVLDPARLGDPASSALDCGAIGAVGARYLERDVAGAVAVTAGKLRHLAVGAQAARQDEADVALLDHVGGAVADARLRPRIGRAREPERVLVEVRRLLGVPDPQLDVIPTLKRHEVGRAHVPTLTRSRAGSPLRRGFVANGDVFQPGPERRLPDPKQRDHEDGCAEERRQEECRAKGMRQSSTIPAPRTTGPISVFGR